jgi:hypothetical protein
MPQLRENVMAKEQKRGNREVRKPKKNKESAPPVVGLTKGASTPLPLPKKKG